MRASHGEALARRLTAEGSRDRPRRLARSLIPRQALPSAFRLEEVARWRLRLRRGYDSMPSSRDDLVIRDTDRSDAGGNQAEDQVRTREYPASDSLSGLLVNPVPHDVLHHR